MPTTMYAKFDQVLAGAVIQAQRLFSHHFMFGLIHVDHGQPTSSSVTCRGISFKSSNQYSFNNNRSFFRCIGLLQDLAAG